MLRSGPSGAGTLILIVGPSGAGKDTLLGGARSRFRDDPTILFLERIITRADQIGEKHTVISESDFARMADTGGFFLAWEAHGLKYGVSADCLHALSAGKTVVVNVSRQIIGAARDLWPNTHVIYVTARIEVRRERLIARGRESADSIDERLRRAQVFDPPEGDWVWMLDNSGNLDEGTARFNRLIADAVNASASSAPEF